jgi:hypothetical protein
VVYFNGVYLEVIRAGDNAPVESFNGKTPLRVLNQHSPFQSTIGRRTCRKPRTAYRLSSRCDQTKSWPRLISEQSHPWLHLFL